MNRFLPRPHRRTPTWLCVVLLGCLWVTPARSASVNVPLSHWSYRAIDTLIGFGVIQTALLGIKPFTRDEMARLIVEAIPRVEELSYQQRLVANRLLRRLTLTFQDEVNTQTGTAPEAPVFTWKPVEEVTLEFVQLDGKPVRMLPESQIDATEGTPLVRNNEDIDYDDGQNVLLTASTHAKLWDRFAFLVQPLFALNFPSDDPVDGDARLHKGYLKAHLGPFEFELGRDSLWWGQGSRGTLVFSNHARPLNLVQLSMPHPVKLPWIFRYLGWTKMGLFFSVLENDRDISRAKLLGGRLLLKPAPWLELGFVAGVQFDGEGVPSLEANDVFEMLTFQNPEGDNGENLTNQLAAVDLRLTIPFLRYSQIYIEYGGEDTSGFSFEKGNAEIPEFLFGDQAFLVGLYVPRLTDDGRTTFRFEWMANDFSNDNTPGVWYGNSTFTSGFTYKRRVLGHAAGGDGQEFFWRLTRDLTSKATAGVDFSYQWRGDVILTLDPTAEKERHYRGGLDLRYFFTDAWEVRTRFAMEQVENANLQSGRDRTNALFLLQIRYHFFGKLP